MTAPVTNINPGFAAMAHDFEAAPETTKLTPERIAEIAKLDPLEYETSRNDLARELGVRASFLDNAVKKQRPREDVEEAPFEDVEPAAEAVNGAELLDDVQRAIERFCVLPEHSAPLMAAWVLHAWAHECFDISPVLGIVSPEKRCGKTTALSIVSALVPRPMHAVNISASVLFRVIEKYKPTVLVDEADTFLDNDGNGDLRGMLNGGHNRLSAYVWRSVGDEHEPRRFKVWSPKAVAMIGTLPDTLEDRSLVVRLRRKEAGEKVERFRADRINDFMPLRQRAARWVQDNTIQLGNADPSIPDALNDRAQDNARAICAIADAAGQHWPKTVRAALVGMSKTGEADEPQSAGVMLLRDLAELFETRRGDRLGSADLTEALCALEESPWAEWRRGSPISPRGVAKLLKPYGIRPNHDKGGSFYRPSDFKDAFARYLVLSVSNTATSPTSVTDSASVINLSNENNAGGTCEGNDTCLRGDRNKRHCETWEGEL